MKQHFRSKEVFFCLILDIIKRVRDVEDPPFRPAVSDKDCPEELLSLMQKCWDEEPQNRPGFDQIVSTLKKLKRSGKSENIMDNLMRRMEQYANNLEGLVEERTKAYVEEKKRAEDLLYRMLPQSVAKDLQMGKQVMPEAFDEVSIYFSDIVGFTTISARSTPHEISTKVYKVETIGDAYMVVSGLPERIGDLHAREISNMSLAIRHSVRNFKIAHLPDTPLRIRIGLHSGAVVAGVVGLTMPRYCLFGDTVNTASRMESNGEAMKIHISAATRAVLETFEYYNIEFRGEIEVKIIT
ncbi:hypothetical protein KUTeg_020617 [Tegillarca granosa]|uniref:Guanylate cyclase domain-containing protein n=1 Tax=Tegillarca granosa TaxID=220873 RepID=A0ABQ9EDP6_TEGGR|nr:hypothetical protein KUTeg_020617 [Tegillarca granosa]